jgi:sugar phosphate permease
MTQVATRPPPAKFRGWWILAASVVAMAVGSGVSFWSFGLYIEPLEAEFGWSRTQVSLGFSISFIVAGASGPLVGRWIDLRGPRSAILVGAVLTAATYLLLASTTSLWQWFLYSSVNALFRQLMFFIPFQVLISRWFDRRRGIALGIFGTGFSLGGFLFVPLMGVVIDAFEWRAAFALSGLATAVIFLPIGVLLVRNSPADVGQVVDGRVIEAGDPPSSGDSGVRPGVALRTPLFWVLAAAMAFFFFGIFGLMVHQIPFFESIGISRRAATAIVSISAGASILTRLPFSWFADRLNRFEAMAMALALVLMASMVTLLVDSGPVGIGIFLLFWTAGRSAGPIMGALLLTRTFGVRYFASLLGTVVVVETVGQVLSPSIAGAIFDATDSYTWALVMYLGTFAISLALFAIARRMPSPADLTA